MTTSITDDPFTQFSRRYQEWLAKTEALPFKRIPRPPLGAFEVDLDHLVDYLKSIGAAAAGRSTQLDYPKVAPEYLRDCDQVESELRTASLSDADRQSYSEYFALCRHLLQELKSLPVPVEGHLGFRKHAHEAFKFLTEQYGFRIVKETPTAVHFSSDDLLLSISYEPQCPMLGVQITGSRNGSESSDSLVLDDIAYAAGLGILFDYTKFNLYESTGIADFLAAAAKLILRNCDPLLRGDSSALQDFTKKAEERDRLYTEMMERLHGSQNP